MTDRPKAPAITEHLDSPEVVQVVGKGVKSLQEFVTKFNNDWVLSFAAALAFNLIIAIFPILIAILGILGLTIGRLDHQAYANLIKQLQQIVPPQLSANFLELAVDSLKKNSFVLLLFAILLAIFGGSGLFVTMEGHFAIIYRTATRGLIKQYIMAIGMLLVFVVLIPLMVFASTIPALVQSVLQSTPISQITYSGLIFDSIGIIASVSIAWVLFEVIYLVVPNQRISFRNSWFGALLAAVAVQVYLLLFPFYVTRFLGSYTGTAGFVVIFLFFFYYFAVIVLAGAEINAFYAMGIGPMPDNLAVMVRKIASPPPTGEKAVPVEVSISHENEEPEDASNANNPEAQATAYIVTTEQDQFGGEKRDGVENHLE